MCDTSIPANTAEGSAVVTELKVWKGVIVNIEVKFPLGCAGLAHVQVRLGDHQLVPTNREKSLSGDDATWSARTHVVLEEETNIIRIIEWNTDTAYDHAPLVAVNVLPQEALYERLPLRDLIEQMGRLISRLGG